VRTGLQAAAILVFGLLGLATGLWLEASYPASSPLNLVYLTLVGALTGLLLAPRIAYLGGRIAAWWRRVPPEAPLAVATGSMLALLAAVLLTTLLGQIPGFRWYHSLLLAFLLVLTFSAVALANRQLFRRAVEPAVGPGGKLLDTSVLIDGRVAEVVALGFLEPPIYVPDFVLKELQGLADSSDPLTRAKGRRGLATLATLGDLGVRVLETGLGGEVDDALLGYAQRKGMAVVSNDSALLALAKVYGVKGLSIQALAHALKAPYQPGQRLRVRIQKLGKEAGQGVGYLEDGTMVVVEGAAGDRGEWVEAVVTQAIQTHLGKMLFARKRPGPDVP